MQRNFMKDCYKVNRLVTTVAETCIQTCSDTMEEFFINVNNCKQSVELRSFLVSECIRTWFLKVITIQKKTKDMGKL